MEEGLIWTKWQETDALPRGLTQGPCRLISLGNRRWKLSPLGRDHRSVSFVGTHGQEDRNPCHPLPSAPIPHSSQSALAHHWPCSYVDFHHFLPVQACLHGNQKRSPSSRQGCLPEHQPHCPPQLGVRSLGGPGVAGIIFISLPL